MIHFGDKEKRRKEKKRILFFFFFPPCWEIIQFECFFPRKKSNGALVLRVVGFSLSFQATKHLRGLQTLNESGIQTVNESQCKANEDAEDPPKDPKPLPNPSQFLNSDANLSVKYSASSSMKASARHDMAMMFTCKVCETRSVKTLCRESYEKGVVLARCVGCSNVHLIADRLGWFGQPGSVEDFLAARGEKVTKGSADTLNLTLEDLVGSKSS